MSHISLEKVHKSFDKGQDVIKDLSLEIFNDEFLVLVGPSGCGKTTTLRMIAGLEELSQGDLYINGNHQNDEDPSSRCLSFVFQNYALLPNLTVEDNIVFGLMNHPYTRLEKKRRVEEIARKLSLYEKLGSYPSQLSGGQKQKVALARALIDSSDIVLFDEPLSNLDAVLRESMRNELISLQKQFKTTCIYVTHDQVEAMAMASRIVLMIDGSIIQVGTPYQMYHDPNHLDVATFIGSPEINVIKISMKNHEVYHDQEPITVNDKLKDIMEIHEIFEAYVSMRPQDIKVSSVKKEHTTKGKLILVEHFGVNKLLHIDALGQTLRVLVSADYMETKELYVDLTGDAFVFDLQKRRMRQTIQRTLIISEYPKNFEDIRVVKELLNYGYEVNEGLMDMDLIYDHKKGVYQFKNQGSWIQLHHMKELLNYLPYIKDIEPNGV